MWNKFGYRRSGRTFKNAKEFKIRKVNDCLKDAIVDKVYFLPPSFFPRISVCSVAILF